MGWESLCDCRGQTCRTTGSVHGPGRDSTLDVLMTIYMQIQWYEMPFTMPTAKTGILNIPDHRECSRRFWKVLEVSVNDPQHTLPGLLHFQAMFLHNSSQVFLYRLWGTPISRTKSTGILTSGQCLIQRIKCYM